MKTTPLLRILADDVTGAADCAARCKNAGLAATILLQPSAASLPAGAVSLSSDSRYLPPAAAAERVYNLLATLQQAEQVNANVIWYKKIDSTLRGNIGAELAAMLSLATGAALPCAVITPAFPAQGRGLVDGYLAYAQAPARALHLPTLIQQQTALPLILVKLAHIRAGVNALAATLRAHYQAGVQLFVADAVTEADLTMIYQATRLALPQALFCGSAGLIGVIATALVTEPVQQATAAVSKLPHPLLAVVGSGSLMAQRQLARLQQSQAIASYVVDPEQVAAPAWSTGVVGCGDCILHLPQPLPGAALEGALARHYAAALAAVAGDWIRQFHPPTLLLVGGDTAFHLLEQLGITALNVTAEVLPGMPLTVGQAADGQRYQIILKAGNHGDEATLVTLFNL